MSATAKPNTSRVDDKNDSIGDLVSDISGDFARLVRDEVNLAKTELREETGKMAKAATFYAVAGFAGYLMVLTLTATAIIALAHVLDAAWAALIVSGVWALIAALGFLLGRSRMRKFSAVPRQTVETLKEDAKWLRHPTS